ncbi:TQO small subunit DoxD [Burkholderia gladioli]|uniref:TQO small subunit DoxD n=1 Tax=Burkholderia gladioli TaxID=28095 RepID=UPI00155FC53E|nr:TQO small subunit DoxD [Burkholderia gladioli]MDN7501024.1 TQO small subunit DoxD [Burkholderia gladioli]MDN7605031.1 TQO small subunit DoxD [Burkholderia gladioli]NRF83577.1 quinol oxidase [Burkholderia gladioli]
MTPSTFPNSQYQPQAPDASASRTAVRASALSMIAVRVIQGFIYWGGGSRRFIYAPSKLNPNATHWMANKFQTALPGALLGMDHVISYMLHHFVVLYAGVIVFSAAELIVGLMLMAGLYTRAAALASMGFSVMLMLMFGWQGATCIDEWTMAACNLAMGATLFLGGGGAYTLDNVLLRKRPSRAQNALFRWASGALPLPLGEHGMRKLALAVLAVVVVFDVSTYSYYRGSVVTPFHSGPVSPTAHHVTLSQVSLTQGELRFHATLDAGTPEAPVHIVQAVVLDANGQALVRWDADQLSHVPKSAFTNDYAYNQFGPGPFGLRAPMGAAAFVTLALPDGHAADLAKAARLRLIDVDGRKFESAIG